MPRWFSTTAEHGRCQLGNQSHSVSLRFVLIGGQTTVSVNQGHEVSGDLLGMHMQTAFQLYIDTQTMAAFEA